MHRQASDSVSSKVNLMNFTKVTEDITDFYFVSLDFFFPDLATAINSDHTKRLSRFDNRVFPFIGTNYKVRLEYPKGNREIRGQKYNYIALELVLN